jgi:hypothetical protein
MNPILPPTAFVPDGEPHVFEYEGEKRLFLYGSRDERVTAFCGYGHDAWSAPLDNLNQWTCHGEIFHVKQVQEIGYGLVAEQHFGAPDCVYNPLTKKYYLYTFLGALYHLDGNEGPRKDAPDTVPGFAAYGPKCVVAQSDSPVGPFVNPIMCDWPAANLAGAFDPSALVDVQEDGSVRVYVYWGMKKGGDRCAEVDPHDMHTIINPESRLPDRDAWRKTLSEPEELNGSTLFEANSIKKIANGRYVFIYSANERISALTYCYGPSPFGPWQYGGRIVDNGLTWHASNDHGSIVDVNGQWYVFYHRQSNNCFSRQAMMEPIDVCFAGDRIDIPMVEMTSQGCDVDGLDAFRRYNIGVCCSIEGDAYIDGAQRRPDGLNPMVGITSGTVIGVKYLNFGERALGDKDGCVLTLNIHLLQDAVITLLLAPPGENASKTTLSVFNLQREGTVDCEYREISLPLIGLETNPDLVRSGGLHGKWALHLRFEGAAGELCQMKAFQFSRTEYGR